MTDLAAFLLARIAEDEAPAREAAEIAERYFGDGDFEIEWTWARHTYLPSTGGSGHSFAPGAPSPARVLAECEAKRRIVDEWRKAESDRRVGGDWESGCFDGLRDAVKLLAEVHADHPDYRDEWRP